MKLFCLSTLMVLLCGSCRTTASRWGTHSIIEDVHLRATPGDVVALAGDAVPEYFVFVSSSFPVDAVTVYLEFWDPEKGLQSRAAIFSGSISAKEARCGRLFISDARMAEAVIQVEKLVGRDQSTGTTHTTSYPLRKLLLPQKRQANQALPLAPGQSAREP
jgi:hypothetical protein